MTVQPKRGPAAWSGPARWALASFLLAASLVIVVWAVVTDAPAVRMLVRLYQDKYFMRDSVAAWGWMAPLVFICWKRTQQLALSSTLPSRSQ